MAFGSKEIEVLLPYFVSCHIAVDYLISWELQNYSFYLKKLYICVMSARKKYRLNPETLLYEMEKVSASSRVLRVISFLVASVILSFIYLWFFNSVLGVELPKTMVLRKVNERWASRVQLMDRRLKDYQSVLEGLGMRDDEIYRNIFGLNEISPSTRASGMTIYPELDSLPEWSPLRRTVSRLGLTEKMAYVQSKSFDDVLQLSRKAGDMASCIPAIIPVAPDKNVYRLTSPFGYRVDPINGTSKFHSGLDFACNPGNPVYATGDGTVAEVNFDLFGYGNQIVIDHGFGYKTRYAHLKTIFVGEGMKLKRGECIGETGNTGRTTGPHLHYEVYYRNAAVNPMDYVDLDMTMEDFKAMTEKAAAESKNVIIRPHQRYRGK
jgi:murein DD-endopeptidase MepM/ murein hydrolase activator NlpD